MTFPKAQNSVSARLIAKQKVARKTYELTFKIIDDKFKFREGQYIWVILKNLKYKDVRGNRRAFSICSSPSKKNELSIVFRKSNSGYKKSLLNLKEGENVQVVGPAGSFDFSKKSSLVLIAGGVGIAPFMSLLRKEQASHSKRKIWLYYFNSDPRFTPYINELEEIERTNDNFVFFPYMNGYKQRLFKKNLKAESIPSSTHFYLVGPQGLIDATTSVVLKRGFNASRFHFEEQHPLEMDKASVIHKKDDYFISPAFFQQAARDVSNHVIFTDSNGHIKFANRAAEKITGYSFEEMQGQTPRLWGGLMEEAFYEELWDTIKKKKKPYIGKIMNRRKNGEIYYALARISPIVGPNKKIVGFVGTEEDVTEEEKLDQVRNEFISLTSHQFRTPLSIIKWYTEVLLDPKADSLTKDQKKYIKTIRNHNQQMVDLVRSLLNMSRIELDVFAINPEDIDLVDFMRNQIILDYRDELKVKKLHLRQEYAKNLPKLSVDPSIYKVIIQNLVSNAIQYTPRGGRIVIKLGKKTIDGRKYILLQVEDNGYGIPEKDKTKIFKKFFRGDNIRKKNIDGTGLGLSITQAIVREINGQIWFESELNKGTTFFVAFPQSGMKRKIGNLSIM